MYRLQRLAVSSAEQHHRCSIWHSLEIRPFSADTNSHENVMGSNSSNYTSRRHSVLLAVSEMTKPLKTIWTDLVLGC
jgi:hypothetical protein